MPFTAAQIAEQVRGEIIGDAAVSINGFAAANQVRPGDLTFADQEAYFAVAEASAAAAILVPEGFTSTQKTLIRVKNPRVAVARLLPLFFPPDQYSAGVHPSAVIDASASVDPTAHIGPNCVIGARAKVGARSVLMGGNHIGHDAALGDDCLLYPNVVIYHQCQVGNRVAIHASTVIGSDGYGYVLDEGRHRKILQIGNVIIHDDVEIGANTAIDRGALGSTVIGQGTKIDNLVHVAHNVSIGRHCIITGQVGFAGSTKMGDYCVVAAQSGIADHLTIGNQATIGAKSGVMRDIPDGGKVLGTPAMPDKQAKRQMIASQQLPEIIRRMRDLEKQLETLKAQINA
jgi:UDP-3-O-[3-hydroxymyristoyl] glucosamine N-acyltransferase